MAQMLDDIIRNLEREEAKVLRERSEMTWEAFKWKRERGMVDGDLLGNLQDPLEIAKKLLQHEVEIMHRVPPQFLHFVNTGKDSKPLANMSPKSSASSIPADSPREDYPPGFEAEVDVETGEFNIRDIVDIRMTEHEDFAADDGFASSGEFLSFLYQYKGAHVRRSMAGRSKEEQMRRLQDEIDALMKDMTPKKGRKILKEAGVIIFSGWDINSTLLFDGFLKKQDLNQLVLPQEIDKLFIGSGYDPDQIDLLQWALYPKGKRPIIVDIEETFGHLMIHQVGKTDPRVTA